MSSILLVVPPLTGHINPLLSVASVLESRGFRVAWAGHADVLRQHIGSAAQCFDLPVIDEAGLAEETQRVRGLDSIRFFYEAFCFPQAEQCMQPLEQAVRAFAPDLIICDHQMLAGALIAEKMHIPWITSITTSASMLKPHSVLDNWLQDKFELIQSATGVVSPLLRPDFSPYACVVFSSAELVGDEFEFIDAPYHFVGPATGATRAAVDFPWEQLVAGRKKILVSLGTVSRDRSDRFYRVMMDALSDMDVQVIMVAPEDLAATAPENFIVRERVPQLQLLPLVDLVVSHAGHNTVCESLQQAKPMVLAPIRDDQPVIARQVVNAGAGLSVRFGKLTVATARKVVERVLAEDAFHQGAEKIQASFDHLRGEHQVVDLVQTLLNQRELSSDVSC